MAKNQPINKPELANGGSRIRNRPLRPPTPIASASDDLDSISVAEMELLLTSAGSPVFELPTLRLEPSAPASSVTHNWQSSASSMKDRFSYAYQHRLFTDVSFVVGQEPNIRRFYAHKLVLSLSSAVFEALFNGDMASEENEIHLNDVEPAAFDTLLRFIYTEEVNIDADTVMATLYAAKKYIIPSLEHHCVTFLQAHLSADNAFMLLSQARLFDEPHLANLCLETIDKNTAESMNSDCFLNIDMETLCCVLQRDSLGILESKMFDYVCKWAEHRCERDAIACTAANLRTVLGSALFLIRFPLMTLEEFSRDVVSKRTGLLTDKEAVDMYLYYTTNPKPAVPFSQQVRCCLTGRELSVSRFQKIESRWGYSGTSDRIRFQVNRKIYVIGFGLYGSISGPSDYECSIQVLHTDTAKTIAQNDTQFHSDSSTDTFRVLFREPVEIQAGCYYTASATLKGPDSYYGTKGARKVTHESINGGKVIFTFCYAAGNNNGTSVEDGQIPEIYFYI